MSGTRIALRPGVATPVDVQSGHASAILLKLNDRLLDDLKNAKDRLQFVTGSTPKLRIGSHSIDLTLAPDSFRNELYASTSAASSADFTFRSVLSHRAEPKTLGTNDAAGTDAALAKLQSTLASYQQEKQAKQANITNTVLPAPKNRFDAAKQQRQDRRRGLLGPAGSSHPGGSGIGTAATSTSGTTSTTALVNEDEVRLKAMRTPIIHMLAIEPTSADTVKAKTHVPPSDLENILTKVGKQVDGKWTLNDRAYKDLDVWQFNYPAQEKRQAAVDNAVRAYDRMRLGKDDRLWQMLLPTEDRDKGICLSRLHLGGPPASKAPAPQKPTSPVHAENAQDGKAPSMATTPRVGASTPRPHNSTADLKKRLLSKNPQKARAAEDAKEKKRKEREVTAADREKPKPVKKVNTKKPEPKKTNNTKYKSAEFVHSSEDESDEDGELHESPPAPPPALKATNTKPSAAASSKTRTSSSDSSDVPLQQTIKAAAKARPSHAAESTTLKPGASAPFAAAKAPLPGKSTPKSTTNLSAPSTQPRGHQRNSSTSKTDSRPTVPSPLGAARPRVASDISDRGALGVQKSRAGVAEAPKGLGITNGVRKRHDTLTSNGDTTPSSGKAGVLKTDKPAVKPNSTAPSKPSSKPPVANGIKRDPDANLKRKADAVSQPDRSKAAIKHRKTDSSASATSGPTANGSRGGGRGDAVMTPRDRHANEALFDSGPSAPTSGRDSTPNEVINGISYVQGVRLARRFRDKYYPKYVELYDGLEAKRQRGETPGDDELDALWEMHRRLEQMKREINVASSREE